MRATSAESSGPGPDERERLQHRVVQVGRDVGALRLPRPRRALVAELPDQPQPPRRQHQGHAAEHDDGRDDRLRAGSPVSTPSPEASPTNSSTPTPASRIPPATRSTLTGVRPPAAVLQPAALHGVQLAPRQPEARQDDHRGQQPVGLRRPRRTGPRSAARPPTTSTAPMAMSVTGKRRPGSMIACRRASRVSALGRTSCAAAAGSPAGTPATRTRTAGGRCPRRASARRTRAAPGRPARRGGRRARARRHRTAVRARDGAAAAGGGAATVGAGCTVRSSHAPSRPGVGSGVRSGALCHQVQGGVRGPPDAARSSGRQDRDMDTSTPTGTAGPDPAPGSPAPDPHHRARPDAEQLLRRRPPPRHHAAPTTAGSAASAAASATGSASTRCWCAASSSRRCCSAGSGSSRTASPGPCCPSAATVASTSRR